jgi:hypothetical protein
MSRVPIQNALVLAGMAASGLSAASAWAVGPDPATVYVQSLAYDGSGCPQGTVGQSIGSDRTSSTLIFTASSRRPDPAFPPRRTRRPATWRCS